MSARRVSLVAVTILACLLADRAAATAAHYKIDFDATWSKATHPNATPTNAHFSRLIGGVHSDAVNFWSPGALATQGIQNMAELGQVTALQSEVQTAINAGTASSVILGSGTFNSPGISSTMFQVTDADPLVTLVSMVAPSPDWFVGVHDLDLRSGTDWKQQVTVDLFTYDAGTDDGVNFTSPDLNAVPHHPITLLGAPFAPTDPRLGTFTFTRLYEGRSSGDFNADGVVDASDYTVWRDSLGRSGIDLRGDGDFNGVVDNNDFAIWQNHFGQLISAGAGAFGSAGVPETASALLLLIGLGAAAIFRRQFQRPSFQLV